MLRMIFFQHVLPLLHDRRFRRKTILPIFVAKPAGIRQLQKPDAEVRLVAGAQHEGQVHLCPDPALEPRDHRKLVQLRHQRRGLQDRCRSGQGQKPGLGSVSLVGEESLDQVLRPLRRSRLHLKQLLHCFSKETVFLIGKNGNRHFKNCERMLKRF